jgi:hypothetical protein
MYISVSMQQLYDSRNKINTRLRSMTREERRDYYAEIEKDAVKRGIKCIDRVEQRSKKI